MESHSSVFLIAASVVAAGFPALAGCTWNSTRTCETLLPLENLESQQSSETDSSEQLLSNSPPAADAATGQPEETLIQVLAQSYWIRSVPASDASESAYRWIYPNLDRLLAATDPLRALHPHLEDSNPVVAANAAVGLMRAGDWSAEEILSAAVGDVRLAVELRCAGAETLGRSPSGPVLLQKLVDTEVRRTEQATAGYSPAVHAELVRALGGKVLPGIEPRLISALTSDADEVILAALNVWQHSSDGQFPPQGLVLQHHSNPWVRAHLATALGRHADSETLDQLRRGLNDPDLRVRTATIRAMGSLEDLRAVPFLGPLLESGVEAERIAAVGALTELGDKGAAAAAEADTAWRVRLVVASKLPQLPGDADISLARRLLDDPSAEVQHQVIVSVRSWPPQIAEPLLLDALEQCVYRSRVLAVESLAATWPEAGELLESFPVGGMPSELDKALAAIRRLYAQRHHLEHQRTGEAEIASRPKVLSSPGRLNAVADCLRILRTESHSSPKHAEALARCREFGPALVNLLEQLVFQQGIVLPESVYVDVLATDSPEFKAADQLSDDDVQIRRRAARQLAEDFVVRSPRPLLLSRLADVAVDETDTIVWMHLLNALADQADESTFRLVYAAVGCGSAGVRQRACEHLKRHPRPRHSPVLLAALGDRSTAVARVAVEALGSCGGDFEVTPVVELLASASDSVQIAAAMTLTRLGRSEGFAAIERLSYSHDEQTRLRVAQAMGELASSEFAPMLIRMLDDRHGIRLAALHSLSKVADCEEAEQAGLHESDRVDAWRRWAARRDVRPH